MDLKLLGIILTVMLAWSGFLVGAVKWLLDRYQSHLDKRFESLERSNDAEHKEWQRIERELLELKATLPVDYVMRDDSIRQEVVINSKLDALAEKIDNFRDRRGNE